jgi:2-keto-4-pentenoate hydratase/2-oxohepta-3-ene-1,7-dioic acid hydratase in catechol pathway
MPASARRLARFADAGRVFWAVLEEGGLARPMDGDPFAGLGAPGAPRPVEGLRWLAPCAPTKIVGVGRNYRAHAAELGHPVPAEPLIFLKPPSALAGHGDPIALPSESERVDFEGEIGVVIGRRVRGVSEAEALGAVLGYTCVNDVTARDLQKKDVQFTRAKGFDTFCPAGPCIATGIDPATLAIETWVNGARRQSAPATDMIFPVARLVAHISRIMTLEPGDLIATGTPEGVGALAPGDEVAVSVAGIGRLVNTVVAAARAGAGPAR